MRSAALVFGVLLMLGASTIPAFAQQTDSTHTVQEGDTLYGIAQEVGASVQSLMRWNDLDTPSSIQSGQTIWIRPPASPSGASSPSTTTDSATSSSDTSRTASADSTVSVSRPAASTDSSPVPSTGPASDGPTADSSAYGRYTILPGDTFITLALRLGTPADSLFALNDSTTAPLPPDSTLRLPRRFSPLTHEVEAGQTLYSLAGEYGVSVRSLRAVNDNLNPDSLQPGQRLRIPGRRGKEIPPPGTWASPDTTGRVARYPNAFAGRLTASGTAYDPDDLVISHPSLPFDSVVLLATRDDSTQTFARVIDRGPIKEGTLLDVSDAVAKQLTLPTDTPSVSLRIVWRKRNAN